MALEADITDKIRRFAASTLVLPSVILFCLLAQALLRRLNPNMKRNDLKFSEYKRGEAIEMRSRLTQKGGPVEEKEVVVKAKESPGTDFFLFFSVASLFVILLVALVAASTGLYLSAKTQTYDMFHDELYSKWALWDTSAPVLVGEFGSSTDGYGVGEKDFWRCMTKFLKQYDLSYAYWPWNGERWYNDTQTFENEGYGLVEVDWVTIRNPKVIEDLVALD